jgi:hypothetical protein
MPKTKAPKAGRSRNRDIAEITSGQERTSAEQKPAPHLVDTGRIKQSIGERLKPLGRNRSPGPLGPFGGADTGKATRAPQRIDLVTRSLLAAAAAGRSPAR